KTSRIKAFVFRFISVPAKWIMTARQYVLNIYTENRAYAKPFKPEFGISDSRFSCYARFPTGAYYICPPNNMDGKMQNCKVQMK
ncbi:hypothetical protein CIK87_06180, partial [Prevotella sp. P5-64]